jgi:septum formation protein
MVAPPESRTTSSGDPIRVPFAHTAGRISQILAGMLFLASQSPRRRELLCQLGLEFGVLDVDVPERREPGEPALDYVSRVAREKAGAGLLQVVAVQGAIVIGADTEVVLDDEVFGKPTNAADAARMLRRLSGRTHRVVSVVWAVSAGREEHALCESSVAFAELTDAQITAYVATEEPFGKAGAYAIQGRAAAFVRRLEGSYSGVMGLPLWETADVLGRFVPAG